MILRHDGLDKLWEENVNWDRLNSEADEDFDEKEANKAYYVPTFGDNHEVSVHDLLVGSGDIINEHDDVQRKTHFKLKELLANHLQIMYRTGKLRWPKTRSAVEAENLYRTNVLIRENFPEYQAIYNEEDIVVGNIPPGALFIPYDQDEDVV
jgi:hypothetical protein